jgi:hypothetical protein
VREPSERSSSAETQSVSKFRIFEPILGRLIALDPSNRAGGGYRLSPSGAVILEMREQRDVRVDHSPSHLVRSPALLHVYHIELFVDEYLESVSEDCSLVAAHLANPPIEDLSKDVHLQECS